MDFQLSAEREAQILRISLEQLYRPEARLEFGGGHWGFW